MDIIKPGKHTVTVHSGIPAAQPIGVILTLQNGYVWPVNNFGFVPTSVEFSLQTNAAVHLSTQRFIYLYSFGAMPMNVAIDGYVLLNEIIFDADGNPKIKNTGFLDAITDIARYHSFSYDVRPILLRIEAKDSDDNTDFVQFFAFLFNISVRLEATQELKGLGTFRFEFLAIPPYR